MLYFIQVRMRGNNHPKPTEFMASLKLITVAQFMTSIPSSNCEPDDIPNLVNFIRNINSHPQPQFEDSEYDFIELLSEVGSFSLDTCESNGLYYLAGWAIHQVLKKYNCSFCRNWLVDIDAAQDNPDATLTKIRSYTADGNLGNESTATFFLCHPNPCIYRFFQETEAIIRLNTKQIHEQANPLDIIMGKIQLPEFPLTCHQPIMEIARKFVTIRLRILAKEKTLAIKEKKLYAGKCAARSSIK